MYQNPYYITTKVSNNAFSFEKRPQPPKLFIPALKEGSVEDVKVGKEIVFEDIDDGKLQSCCGLENFIKTKIGGIPAYIFDNHNHAFYFWYLERHANTFHDGALLIHADQHKDNRIPESFLAKEDTQDLQKVFTYTNTVLNVGNFIPPAQKTGLISDVIFLDSEYSLKELDLQNLPAGDIILDLDLDFFCPDMDYIGNGLKLEVLAKIAKKAKMITIATSPYFIEQERALSFLHQFYNKI